MLCVSGGPYSLKSTTNDGFFKKLFMGILFFLRIFAEICWEEIAEQIFIRHTAFIYTNLLWLCIRVYYFVIVVQKWLDLLFCYFCSYFLLQYIHFAQVSRVIFEYCFLLDSWAVSRLSDTRFKFPSIYNFLAKVLEFSLFYAFKYMIWDPSICDYNFPA